jgi:uncharacterized protein (TIGR02246 family)
MKKLFMLMPLVFLICFTFGCQQGEEVAEEPVVDVEAEKQAIRDLLAHYVSAITAGDIDAWYALFTEDAVFMPPNDETMEGREEVRKLASSFFETFHIGFEQTIDDVEVFGDWGFARWHCKARYTPKAGGETILENVKEVWIFKRQDDDSWKCSLVIWNSNDPLPTSQENQ